MKINKPVNTSFTMGLQQAILTLSGRLKYARSFIEYGHGNAHAFSAMNAKHCSPTYYSSSGAKTSDDMQSSGRHPMKSVTNNCQHTVANFLSQTQ